MGATILERDDLPLIIFVRLFLLTFRFFAGVKTQWEGGYVQSYLGQVDR